MATKYSDLEYAHPSTPKFVVPPASEPVYEDGGGGNHVMSQSQDGMLGSEQDSKYPFPNKGERMILGVRPPTFWLSLALVVVILAAAIGGGVSGNMAVQNAKSACKQLTTQPSISTTDNSTLPTPTDTISTTDDIPSTISISTTPLSVPTDAASVALNCPEIDNTNLRVTLVDTSLFRLTCGQEIGKPDILAVVVYNPEDCARACASYNRNQGKVLCKGAVFDAEFERTVRRNYGTCFLKSNVTALRATTNRFLLGLVLQ